MKQLLLVLGLFFIGISFQVAFAANNQNLRDYTGLVLPKGTFIPAITAQEISTAYTDVGTPLKFISTSDLYLYETNAIPQNTDFFGYIEKINEPVVGTNASMLIRISKLRLSDGFEIPLKGYIYTTNGNLIGGELTDPASYDKKVSQMQGYPLLSGLVPGSARKMGEHKVIASGAEIIIVLTEPLYITHTVTN